MSQIDPEEIERQLLNLSREPFRRSLIKLLRCAEDLTDEELLAFARKTPDRLWQAITQNAKLAGYSEKHELSGDLPLLGRIKQMSDSELRAEMTRLDREYAELHGRPDQQEPSAAARPSPEE